MAVAQGQKGEWMRMPISLIAYTYASHSENTILMQISRAQISEQSEKGGELWSSFLML